jgi:hypothetical protein
MSMVLCVSGPIANGIERGEIRQIASFQGALNFRLSRG